MSDKMKNILVVSLSGLVLFLVLAFGAWSHKKSVANYDIVPGPVANAKADIVIEGPKEVKVGQLARLDVTKSAGKTFKWRVLPEGVDFEVYDDGRKVIFSSSAAGDYTFIAACANDNDVDVKYVTIHVGEGTVVPPGPNPPTPPGPNPAAGLKGKVVEWAKLVNSPNKKAEAAKLSASFSSVAADVKSGKLKTAEDIIAATKTANRAALGNSINLWVPFLEPLQKEMRAEAEAGVLVTTEQHAQVWSEIADGLNTVSK